MLKILNRRKNLFRKNVYLHMSKKTTILIIVVAALLGILFLGFLAFLQYLLLGGYTPYLLEAKKPALPVPMPAVGTVRGPELVETGAAGGMEVPPQKLEETPYRKVIYEAYLKLKVENAEEKAREAESIALKYGGYVGNLQVSGNRARVTLRIPTENFYSALNDVRNLGELEDENIRAIDVTEEYIDLVARLNNSKNVERRLLALLDKASTVEEILKVEAQLKVIREEIERLTAKLRYIENRIEYSTIVVEFVEPEKVEIKWPSLNILEAIAKGLASMYAVIYALIVIVFALIPLAVLGGFIYLVYKLYKKRFSKTK